MSLVVVNPKSQKLQKFSAYRPAPDNSTQTGNAYVGRVHESVREQSVILTNMDSRVGSTHTVGATPATTSRYNAM
ncbi:hypothetical protein E2C01_085466 [Portunus trituberculatus]|uniref:Uncharacterized protein n=1 Tax=Portunus trituberculatus TaxID=210409 RepID=A0A5B7JAJ7_PORTR|nr:hypothetical protein [Portunus trituberculatus]